MKAIFTVLGLLIFAPALSHGESVSCSVDSKYVNAGGLTTVTVSLDTATGSGSITLKYPGKNDQIIQIKGKPVATGFQILTGAEDTTVAGLTLYRGKTYLLIPDWYILQDECF